MSTYVMSDIHGCYDEFKQMLSVIEFTEKDTLIIAGDYIDRGPKSYEMLHWIEKKPDNVILVAGNHDKEFEYNIQLLKTIMKRNKLDIDVNSPEQAKVLYDLADQLLVKPYKGTAFFDYYGTLKHLINEKNVTLADLNRWELLIADMPYYYRLTMGDRECVIVHAGYIESLEGVNTEGNFISVEDFYIYARDDAYMYGGIPHGMIIAGHTPTTAEQELPFNNGDVYRAYDEELDCIFYDIDCGCVMRRKRPNGKLACIRLEDEKIFYVV
jgi:serine/threonine protein phosphatase 1